jgi:hypothetical protein
MDLDTKKRLEDFISIVEKIKNARFTKETKNISFNLNFQAGEPIKQEVTGFDEEDLRSVLLDLRKFTLKKDGVRLTEICDLLIANSTNQEITNRVQKCKDLYAEMMKEPSIKMIINSESETGKAVMDKWLYGHYFHEAEYSKDLEVIGVGLPMHKTNFVIAVTDLIKLSAVVANNAKELLVLTK